MVQNTKQSKSSDAKFELYHVATFVEADYTLTPEDVMTEVVNLDTNIVVPARSRLELHSDCVKVIRLNKNEVTESAPWDKVFDQGLIVPIDSKHEQRILLVFRITLNGSDSMGYQSQLLVFEVDSERKGRLILEQILNHKEKTPNTAASGSVAHGETSWRFHQEEKFRHEARPKRRTRSSAYGSTVYMLNRCLDDIEHFGKRLNRCVEYDESSGSYNLVNLENMRPQNHRDLIECVRKIKYTLNMNQELQKSAPEASQKIFVRLIKIIRWLDDVCQAHIVPDYDANLVRDVVEPLLNEQTIQSVIRLLPTDLQSFWEILGPAWNTSSVHWPNPLSSYMPQFKTSPAREVNGSVRRELLRHYIEADEPEVTYRVMYDGDTPRQKKAKPVPKVTRPKFRNRDHERFYQKVQQQGGRLCFTTVRHVCAKPSELYADQGEVFELLDDSNEDWWTVENYAGDRGQVPKWKLHPLYLDSSLPSLKQSDQEDETRRNMAPIFRSGDLRSSTDSVFYPEDVALISPRKKDSTLPRTSRSYTDDTIVAEHANPIVLYLSRQQIETMKSQPPSVPIILMPYGQHSSRNPISSSKSATFRTKASTNEDRSALLMSGSSLYSPRTVSRYRPKIVLDSSLKPIVN